MDTVSPASPTPGVNDSEPKMSTAAVGARMKAVANRQEELAKRVKKIPLEKERHTRAIHEIDIGMAQIFDMLKTIMNLGLHNTAVEAYNDRLRQI